jgi:dTMP kinase
VKIDDLITRVIQSSGFDYWESGMDLHLGEDRYDSFVEYQGRLMAQFDKMADGYGFEAIDASGSIEEVFDELKNRVARVLHAKTERPSPSGKIKG